MKLERIFWSVMTVLLLSGQEARSGPAEAFAAFEIAVEQATDARLGSSVRISINYLSGSELFDEYKLLIGFDANDLEFVGAKMGAAANACGWESFDYQTVPCSGCDTQVVELSGVADIDNGSHHPTCLAPIGELAELTFKMPTLLSYAGRRLDINFIWLDCESNTMNSVANDTVWHGKFAYDQEGGNRTGLDPKLGGTLPNCIAPGDAVPIRGINFHSGSITITTATGLYGDINGDGKLNLSDATYLVRYILENGPEPKDYLGGDLDQDGEVDLADVLVLMNYLFGIED